MARTKRDAAKPGSERRYARTPSTQVVEIDSVGRLEVRNQSFDGALLRATAAQKKLLPLGAILHLTLGDLRTGPISLIAGVVRQDAAGVAVVWNAPQPEDAHRLAALCRALSVEAPTETVPSAAPRAPKRSPARPKPRR